jgi:hypothetical protein
MSRDPKKTPAETWDALEKMALEDEVDRVLGLSDAKLDEELEAAGLDPKAIRERGRRIGQQLEGDKKEEPASGDTGAWVSEPPPPASVPLRGLTRRSVWLIAAVLAAAIGGGAAVAAGMFSKHETPPVNDLPDAGPSKVETAPAPTASGVLIQGDTDWKTRRPK